MLERRNPAESSTAAIDEHIKWVLDNPAMSHWLKAALVSALREDPLAVANDLEILRHLIVPRTDALVRAAVSVRN